MQINQNCQLAYTQIESELNVRSFSHLSVDVEQSNLSAFVSNKYLNALSADEVTRLKQEMDGHGPLKNIFDDFQVTEIMVQSYDCIWYEKNGQFLKLQDQFYTPQSYANFVQRLCQQCHVCFDRSHPVVNTKWNSFRVHLVSQPLSESTILTLRRIGSIKADLSQLKESSWCDEYAYQLLLKILHEKKSVLIIGSTGSGKTTALNSLLNEIKSNERCIIIEDTDEIIKPNDISVKMLTRDNLADQNDLLKHSLRMRPERIILGEVRSSEAKDYLLALSTGHGGSLCTLHADNSLQALHRLEMLVQMGAPQWSLETVRRLIRLSIDYILVIKILNGQRKLFAIDKITSLESHGFTIEPEWKFN